MNDKDYIARAALRLLEDNHFDVVVICLADITGFDPKEIEKIIKEAQQKGKS